MLLRLKPQTLLALLMGSAPWLASAAEVPASPPLGACPPLPEAPAFHLDAGVPADTYDPNGVNLDGTVIGTLPPFGPSLTRGG